VEIESLDGCSDVSADGTDSRILMEKFKSHEHIMRHKMLKASLMEQKPAQILLMAKLRHAPGTPPRSLRISELASAFGITASSITQMVTGLEARGLVSRMMDATDRRVVRVVLTETGHARIDGIFKDFDSVFARLVEYMGSRKTRQLISLLSEVNVFFDGIASRHKENPIKPSA
jgi:DNA-binding MarR family transcriptional regulator